MPNAGRPSLYELLGVSPDVSQPDLARAYRRRARELPPDTAAGSADDEAFAELAQAYRLLADPTRRTAYDATLRPPRPGEPTTTPHAIPVPNRPRPLQRRRPPPHPTHPPPAPRRTHPPRHPPRPRPRGRNRRPTRPTPTSR